MIATIHPSVISGQLIAPPSKSAMQRACAAALLCGGETILHQIGRSKDDLSALEMIKSLGAQTEAVGENSLRIISNGVQPKESIMQCGESGLGLRMFTAIAAISALPLRMTGTGTLLQRPMHFFDEVLPKLGVSVKSNEGKLPLDIQGPLQPATVEIDGSLSSQFLTGLLMAYSALNAKGVSIHVKNLMSKPYIDLTLDVMAAFGMSMPKQHNYKVFAFDDAPFNTIPSFRNYTVEGDWSGAAFLLVAGAIAGEINVVGLNTASKQADKAILEALHKANAKLNITPAAIQVSKSNLKAFHFDATECPDLFPPLAVLAAYAEGTSCISGISRLAHKESNRGITLQKEFQKLGVMIHLKGDEMLIEGSDSIQGAVLHSHHDHRIAMAAALAGLRATSSIVIEDADAIKKSYPHFFEDLKKLGTSVSLSN